MIICICRGILHCMTEDAHAEGSRGDSILVNTIMHLLFHKRYSWRGGEWSGRLWSGHSAFIITRKIVISVVKQN